MASVTSVTGTGDVTACMELVLHDEQHQPMSLESELLFSVSLSISLFVSMSLRFDLASVSCVSRSVVV